MFLAKAYLLIFKNVNFNDLPNVLKIQTYLKMDNVSLPNILSILLNATCNPYIVYLFRIDFYYFFYVRKNENKLNMESIIQYFTSISTSTYRHISTE